MDMNKNQDEDLTWLALNVHEWDEKFNFITKWHDGAAAWAVHPNGAAMFHKSDWLARRAELQNKPSWSDAPGWAQWLNQDEDGQWYWESHKPEPRSNMFVGGRGTESSYAQKGVVLGDWRDTLEQRTDMRKSEPEIDTSAERVQKAGGYVHFDTNENAARFADGLAKHKAWLEVGQKHDHGKPILGAIPPNAELAVGRVLTFGAQQYSRGNWEAVEDFENRYMDAALRHLNAHRRGEECDDESGESHLAHAACCVLFLLEKQLTK